MASPSVRRGSLVFFLTLITGVGVALAASAATTFAGPAKSARTTPNKIARASKKPRKSCGDCKATAKKKAARARVAEPAPCKAPGYMDPAVRKNYNAAMRDLKRSGIKPVVTSTWRSSEHQARLHNCSRSKKCRKANPGLYYAKAPGSSLHEAGFAVDISGVASGPRGAKRLTPRGRRIVRTMQKNGFRWRYGLADPAHFEADPTRHGYRSTRQAIKRSQSKCQVNLASGKKQAERKRSRSSKQVSRSGRPGSQKSRS